MSFWNRSLVLAVLCAGFVGVASAELKTADEVIAKHIEARGGMDKIQAIKSMRTLGKMTMGPMEMPFTAEMKRPSQMRLEFNFQGMNAVQAFDGEKGWQIMPMMGKTDPEPMSEDDLKNIREQADFDGAMVDYAKKGNTVELVGMADLEGTPAYKLKVTKKNGDVETNYIDGEYFMLLKTESKMKIQGQDVDGSSSLGDYKEVAGVMFPHSISNGFTMGGQEMKQTMVFESYEANPTLVAERFAMPKVATPAAEPAKK